MTKNEYLFVSRTDEGEEVIVRVDVDEREIVWSGESEREIETMKAFLTGREWHQLGNKTFDLENREHYSKLPWLLHGSRLWVHTRHTS